MEREEKYLPPIFTAELRSIWSKHFPEIKKQVEKGGKENKKQIKHGDYGYFEIESGAFKGKRMIRLFLHSRGNVIKAFDPLDVKESCFGKDVNAEKRFTQYIILGNLEMPITV